AISKNTVQVYERLPVCECILAPVRYVSSLLTGINEKQAKGGDTISISNSSTAAQGSRLPGPLSISLLFVAMMFSSCAWLDRKLLDSCLTYYTGGFRPIATDRAERFLGKVQKDTARCRGGEKAVDRRDQPWVDWQNYWATGDETSRAVDWTRLFG